MEEYKRKPYLSNNYKKRSVSKHSSECDVLLVAGSSRGRYLDIGALIRGEGYQRGENIDRIKLPCFCSFEWKGSRRLGMIIFLWYKETGMCTSTWRYGLIDMSEQSHKQVGNIVSQGSLEYLLEEYKINIGKAHIDFCETYY